MARKFQKMMMVPVEDDPETVNWFKGQLTDDPILTQAAKLAARQKKVLDNPRMKPAEKRSRLQQLQIPFRKLLKRLRQLPGIGARAGAVDDEDELEEDEAEDLVTNRQQKILSNILKAVTPKRKRPVTTTPETPPSPPAKAKKTPRRRITRTKAAKELPFFGEDIPFEAERTAERIVRKARKRVKTPLAQSRIRTAPGWQDWDQQGIRKRLSFKR